MRAEWAYNLCAGAEQMLDEPQVRLFWGALHGQLSEDVYWGLRAQWQLLREQVFRHSKDGEVPTIMNPWTEKEFVVQHLREPALVRSGWKRAREARAPKVALVCNVVLSSPQTFEAAPSDI